MIKNERLRFRNIWSMMTRSIHERWHERTNKCVRTHICEKSVFVVSVRNINICGRIPRPCSLIWDKWNGSGGETPCPCHGPTCPTKIWRQPSPCPTCPTKIWRPLLLVPLVPRTPTCSNLSHLDVQLVLFQLAFLRFFFGFLITIPFFEKHIWMKSLLQSTIMLERVWMTDKFRRQQWPYSQTHECILFRV